MQPLQLCLLVALGALALGCRSPAARAPEAAAGTPRPTSIAVVPFGLVAGSAPPLDVAEVIRADLAARGFAPMAIAEMPAQPTRMAEIRFEDWQRVQAEYLVVGIVARVHDGGHEVEFRLIDVATQARLVEFLVPSAPDALHGTALEIAKRIEQRIVASQRARAGGVSSRLVSASD